MKEYALNQSELIAKVAEVADLSKTDVEQLLKTVGSVVHSELKSGGEVTLPSIGKLTVKHKAARKGRNPATGKEINIAAKTVPAFSAAKALKDAVA
ncbi:MAG TPA: HU family DNA-binding protein [Rhodocyclaceae bacterium]|nr:HU family DNA-binding protein [Rhodocyclaceae bacterium]